MVNRQQLQRLQHIEQHWADIETSYCLTPYNAPLNRQEEFRKTVELYHAGVRYDPTFVYQPPPVYPSQQIRAFLTELEPAESPLEKAYYDKAVYELGSIASVQTHRPDIITYVSSQQFGRPDAELINAAERILTEGSPLDGDQSPKLTADAARSLFETALRYLGLWEWQVVIYEPMNARLSVYCPEKQVRIRNGATFSRQDVERLMLHEIGVHVTRYENGAQQPIQLFKRGFPHYLEIEEGLAVYTEKQRNVLPKKTLRIYAARVLAAAISLDHPFSTVFAALAPLMGVEEAFNITLRAKRGFIDTAQPGAHTKDIVYLKGYLAVCSHLHHNPDDYPLLFAGKFGLDYLTLVRELVQEAIISLPERMPYDLPLTFLAGVSSSEEIYTAGTLSVPTKVGAGRPCSSSSQHDCLLYQEVGGHDVTAH